MIGIGAIIGIAASVFQAVQAANRSDAATQKTDQLFSQIDLTGKGALESTDLQTAFDKIATNATLKADELFSNLDADSNGKVTKEEFSSSIIRLTEQLDQHYANLRMQSAMVGNTSFSKDDLTGLTSKLANNFDKVDADGDGKVSGKEASNFLKTNPMGSASVSAADNQNIELMLQVMRLMQAYGTNQAGNDNSGAKPQAKVSVSA